MDNVELPIESKTPEIKTRTVEKKRGRPAKALPTTNYEMIEKLTKKLIEYLESQNIESIDKLTDQIVDLDSASKLAFVKAYMCPRVNGMRNEVVSHAKDAGVTLASEALDRIEALLRAMCEVAEA